MVGRGIQLYLDYTVVVATATWLHGALRNHLWQWTAKLWPPFICEVLRVKEMGGEWLLEMGVSDFHTLLV